MKPLPIATLVVAALVATLLPVGASAGPVFRSASTVIEDPVLRGEITFSDTVGEPGDTLTSSIQPLPGSISRTISVQGGQYRICAEVDCRDLGSGGWSTATGRAIGGQNVQLRAQAGSAEQAITVRLQYGPLLADWSVLSEAFRPLDFGSMETRSSGPFDVRCGRWATTWNTRNVEWCTEPLIKIERTAWFAGVAERSDWLAINPFGGYELMGLWCEVATRTARGMAGGGSNPTSFRDLREWRGQGFEPVSALGFSTEAQIASTGQVGRIECAAWIR